ncbi:MAG: glycosyltransferase family 39 protein [Candidatus Riflebacteria bacterium]|nr:glycosyltransferase family 39 protein [Candidatus Riflebacteria bacterium]
MIGKLRRADGTLVAVAVLAVAWALLPRPCSLASSLPLLFDEGVLLEDALDLAEHGLSGQSPSYMGRPLHRMLVAGAFRLAGTVAWAGALVSSVSAALTLIVVFSLGRHLGGERVGLLAAGLLATSNLFGHYSRTALSEADSLLFFCLALRSVVVRAPGAGGLLACVPAGLWFGLSLAANPRMGLALPWLVVAGLPGLSLRQLALRLGLAACAVPPLVMETVVRWAHSGQGAGSSSFASYVTINLQLFSPGALHDYPLYFAVVEGPVFTGLTVLALWLTIRVAGPARSVAATGPLVTLVLSAVVFGHHALRYLLVYCPGFALAMAVALDRLLPVGSPGRTRERMLLAALVLAAYGTSSLTRPPLPAGHNPAYASLLPRLEKAGARDIMTSHYRVLGFLQKTRKSPHRVFPPVRIPWAMRAMVEQGVTHCVLDFERWFLDDYVHGRLEPEVLRGFLASRLTAQVIENPSARGPYLWFEHGYLSPVEHSEGFESIEIYDLAGLARNSAAGGDR